MGVKIFV